MTACPLCGAASRPVLRIEGVPVLCNVLHDDADAARSAATGDLDLHGCPSCTHLFNAAFDDERIVYGPDYENSLHASPTFVEWATGLANGLVTRHDLTGKPVAEIACGKGEFLALLRDAGAGPCVGFDPSWDPDRAGAPTGLEIRAELFDAAAAAAVAPALVVCRHALEHVADPVGMLAGLRAAAGSSPLYLEVPNGLWTLRDLGVWDLIYEHPHVFTARSLAGAVARAGFVDVSIIEDYGGQFLGCTAGMPLAGSSCCAEPDPAAFATLADGLGDAWRRLVSEWRERLSACDGRAVAWGAGSKGVTFVNAVDTDGAVAALVDRSPVKRGRFVPGAARPVIAPTDLCAEEWRDVTLVLVMNPRYETEIRAELASLGLSPEIATV